MLRIVHVMSSFAGGGMEHFVLRLAAAQRARGHEASILGLQGGGLLGDARRLGIPAEIPRAAALMPLRVLEAAARMARRRPDIVHAHNPTALHYGVLGKLLGRARLVLTDHRGVARTPTRVEWRLTDAVVAVSEDTARACPTAGRGVQVIYNGVAEAAPARPRAEVRAALGLQGDEVVGVHVANLRAIKAHDVALRALVRLRDDNLRFTLLLVGDGPDRPALEDLARALDVGPDRVRFLGSHADVPDLLVSLGAADLFVLSSRMEGLPLAVLEAMAQSLPVVTTRVGGVPEVVDDERTGLLVPSDDSAALAAAIGRLARDAARRARLGAAGRARALTRFSFPHMVDEYECLYRRLLGRARGRAG
jgi:L-malate glycosyltransferase